MNLRIPYTPIVSTIRRVALLTPRDRGPCSPPKNLIMKKFNLFNCHFYSSFHFVKSYGTSSSLNKELRMIEWEIFILKIMIIFSLYIFIPLSLDIILVIFSYGLSITGHVVMCADLPGSEEPLDVDYANQYESMSKDEMKSTAKTLADTTSTALVGLGVATGFKAISDGVSGDLPSAATYGTLSAACVVAGGLASMAGDEACRKINNLPDDHNPERAPSPSVYGSDGFKSPMEPTMWEKIKEHFQTLADNIINNHNTLADIINNYLSTLDNENRVIISIILLLMFAFNFYMIKNVKNYMNKKINHIPFNNKYYKMFIQYKNFMNKISNYSLNIMIGFCLTFALFGVLMLIFLF